MFTVHSDLHEYTLGVSKWCQILGFLGIKLNLEMSREHRSVNYGRLSIHRPTHVSPPKVMKDFTRCVFVLRSVHGPYRTVATTANTLLHTSSLQRFLSLILIV